LLAAAFGGPFMLLGGTAQAQAIGIRQWEGSISRTRAPEQAYAGTMAEWRGLWSRVGSAAPDMFEPGRTSAVGIFLGTRAGPGYSVNIVSAIRRRDRIMLVFEEIAPAEVMMAQRMPSAPRAVASGTNLGGGPGVGSAFAPPGVSSLAPTLPPAPTRPISSPTSPWAIVLFNRTDLPITVEQRLFR
jgi:hypothetical protein